VGSILQPSPRPMRCCPRRQGAHRSGREPFAGMQRRCRPCTFEERKAILQMFDPRPARHQARQDNGVASLHGTATLLPDASVFSPREPGSAGSPDDPSFPLMSSYAGLLPRGDPDQGVPVGQVFSRLTCSKHDGSRRRVRLSRRRPGKSRTAGTSRSRSRGIRARLPRSCCFAANHNTHSLTTGDRYVKLAFRARRDDDDGELRVRAPKLPRRRFRAFTCSSSWTGTAYRAWADG